MKTLIKKKERPEEKEEPIILSLIDAPLISGEGLEWEQILEIKQDKHATRDLRNFRLLINESLSNYSRDHVLDLLEKKYEDYLQAIKKHGILTTTGVLKQVIRSNSVIASATAATMGAATGNNVILGTGTAVSALLALSEFSIQLAERKASKDELMNNEMVYVYKINQKKL